MSLVALEKQVLSEIPEEEQKTNDGDPIMINGGSEVLRISQLGTTESMQPGLIGRRTSDETTFIIPQGGNMNKPIMRFDTTLAVNLYQIKEIFEKVCKKRGFEIVDDEGDQVTAVNKRMINIKDLILSCIPGSTRNYQNLTAIRLHSKTNKVTCIRRITLKALLGDTKKATTLFLDFERELEAYNGRRANMSPRLNGGTSFFGDTILSASTNLKGGAKYIPMRDDMSMEVDESVISTQNLESSSFYEFRKILSSEQYSIGKKVADFVKDFAESYKNIGESADLLPQPMESVYLLVNEITETFFADFNYGKSETKQMMPYCRISVEKFIFDKVNAQLYSMYLVKFEEQTKRLEEKIQKISQKTSILSQLKFLDILPKFWLIPAEKLNENSELIGIIEPEEVPYIEAINELSKISKLKSPREKLGVLLMMHSLMKSAVVDFHKGKEEVLSMDEELPIIIFILLHAKLKNVTAEFNFVDDYVQFDPALESEKRLMTNLKVSLQYIADEWPTI